MKDHTCSVAGCERPSKNAGMCWRHYKRNRKYGDPLGGGLGQGEMRTFVESAAMSSDDECILFPSKTSNRGYGTVYVNGRVVSAHRYAATVRHGEPPAGAYALHSCHTRACLNGMHLRWGTPVENMADKIVDGTDPRGSRNPIAKLTEAQVLDIVQSGRTIKESAELYGVTRGAIEDIMAGRNWSWLTGITRR